MRRGILILAGLALAATACASGDSEPAVPLECEREGYPCSLTEVPDEILERSDHLGDEVVAMFEAGASREEVDTWLEAQDGVAELESDDEALWFRLHGGRGTWVLRAGAFATRGSAGFHIPTGIPSAARTVVFPHVVGPESESKDALVLSPFLWDFGDLDDGDEVNDMLAGTRGYEGRVSHRFNRLPGDTAVTVADFRDWRGLDVVHVVSHGARINCRQGPCRAAIAAQVLLEPIPTEPGVTTVKARLLDLADRGLELAKVEGRGLELDTRVTLVMLTADFFMAHKRPTNAIVFFNGCEVLADDATDLANAVAASTNVFLGWDDIVSNRAAFAAAEAFYRDLTERGYPVEVAIERLGALRIDPFLEQSAVLEMVERPADEDLRARDIVELLEPGSDRLLAPSSLVPIHGIAADGEPDTVPYAVRVDGIRPEFADMVVLHLSIDGTEIDPQPLTNGRANDKDQWVISGEAPLGFDLEEDTPVVFEAWVKLHSGGESKDTVTATVTGAEPIMGWEWTLVSDVFVSSPGPGLDYHATLTLEFAEGQDPTEPHPRYVVTGGHVIYGARSGSKDGCLYSRPEVAFDVSASSSPSARDDGFAPSVLVFDTTVSPVEYHGVIYTDVLPDLVQQTCDDSPITINYGTNVSWLIVDPSDHLKVVDRRFISDTVEHAVGHVFEFTITRTR